jgi:hypothetical protein
MAEHPLYLSTELEGAIAQTVGWPRRYTIVVLLALATAICYLDRVNISIAIIPLARDKGCDAAATRSSCPPNLHDRTFTYPVPSFFE